MAKYSSAFNSPVVFSPQQQSNGLSEVVSNLGLSQFHVAETEKYAHVTFFFNGGREEPFSGEVREMKESPKVATYDLEPKMAAEPVADAMVREVEAGVHALLVCNLAPPDMVTAATPVPALHFPTSTTSTTTTSITTKSTTTISTTPTTSTPTTSYLLLVQVGHTGMMDKAIEATTHTDMCIGKIRDACTKVPPPRLGDVCCCTCTLVVKCDLSPPSTPPLPPRRCRLCRPRRPAVRPGRRRALHPRRPR